MNDSSVCFDVPALQDFLSGRVSGDEAGRVEEHLAHCADCRRTLDALRKALTTEAVPPTPGFRPEALTSAGEDATIAPGPMPEDAVPPVSPSAKAAAEPYPFLAPPQQPDELGRLGCYRVLRVIGVGGMGVVFEAEDPKLQRRVALKVMRPAGAAQVVFRERFLREARASARLEHDHVVPVYQVDEDRGVLFLAMPLLRGETLEDRLDREPKPPVAEVLRIGREIAEGLDAAHSCGLIHRDIKPSNVWLESGRGRVKILDFGLARVENDGDANLTREGLVMGTPAFMAPEQAKGLPLDPRCDLFSLGCVLYRMCTGRNPFESPNTFSLLVAVTTADPPPPCELSPDLPPDLAELVMQLLAKEPEGRPASAREVADRLAAMGQSGQTTAMIPAMPPVVAPAPVVRRGQPPITVAVVLVILGVLAGVAWNVALQIARRFQPADAVPPPDAPAAPAEEPAKAADPLSGLALVGRPAPLPGVRGWTVETRGHRGPVTDAVCCPKGGLLATAGTDGTVRLWDLEEGKLARVLLAHDYEVRAAAWSPDGKTLASLGGGGAVDLWEAESGRLVQSLHVGPSRALAWSPDGARLATAGLDKKIHVWDAETGKNQRALEGPAAEARALAWSADGKLLAAAGADRGVGLWDADKSKDVRPLGDPKTEAVTLAWSADGKLLAVGRADLTVQLWDLNNSDKLLQTLTTSPSPDKVRPAGVLGLAWAPKGRTLAVIHGGGVQLWKPDSDKPFRTVPTHGTAVSWSADGRRLVTAGDENEGVRVWDVAPAGGAPTLVTALPGYKRDRVHAEHWSPDGKRVAFQGDQTVWLFGAATGRLEHALRDPAHDLKAVAWSPDGQRIAAVEKGTRKVHVWDAATGKDAAEYTSPHSDGEVTALGWSPDGKTLAVAVEHPAEVALWDVAGGGAPVVLKGRHEEAVNAVLWIDGKTVATGSADGSGVFWNAETGKPGRTVHPSLPGPLRPVTALVAAPDGKAFACGLGQSFDHAARIFSMTSEKSILNLRGAGVAVGDLTWLPDGKTMAGRGDDGALRFWDGESGQVTRTLPARPGVEYFLPERGFGASASAACSVRYWGLDDFRPETAVVLLQQGLSPCWLTVSGDGHYQTAAGFESEVVYVVQTDAGLQTLTPKEFAAAYSWHNDPSLVALPGAGK